ncbi:hypothetical protein [Guptibacillus hwajinpoensis]|uniref:hypothetical protein n=1 Tax=Guptibacillus hwajinpoensis TaxID=208199 RepID=UPI001CFCFFCF|nr:hypothetical protein [Pseudalkalibacillus hwajinpoensis]WLR59041.1 hypothetical protein LC071_18105 [Pseudalkalibacillus hwajinpoensis]
MEIIIPNGCNNTPRKQIVIDFTVAMLKMQNEIIKEYADESIIWYQLKDNKKIEGRCSLITILKGEDNNIIEYLEIYQVITHGKFASINGVILLANDTKIDFGDVYMFINAARSGKVKEIKSYRI